MDIVDVLACLFMLGSLELGQVRSFWHQKSSTLTLRQQYSNEGLSATQDQVLSDLADYGLVMRSEVRSSHECARSAA